MKIVVLKTISRKRSNYSPQLQLLHLRPRTSTHCLAQAQIWCWRIDQPAFVNNRRLEPSSKKSKIIRQAAIVLTNDNFCLRPRSSTCILEFRISSTVEGDFTDEWVYHVLSLTRIEITFLQSVLKIYQNLLTAVLDKVIVLKMNFNWEYNKTRI